MAKTTIAHSETAAELAERQHREFTEKVLGSPVFLGLNEPAEKVRRNVLIFSFVAIFSVNWGVTLNPGEAIFGLTFEGLTEEKILGALLVLTFFSLVHFVWLCADGFVEWRLRLTGTELSTVKIAKAVNPDGDYPEDPRQSTLYSWWMAEAARIGSLSRHLTAFELKLAELTAHIRQLPDGAPEPRTTQTILQAMSGSLERLNDALDNMKRTSESRRPSISLARFDNWFTYFRRSQNWRWGVLDVGAPCVLALYALYLLVRATWPWC